MHQAEVLPLAGREASPAAGPMVCWQDSVGKDGVVQVPRVLTVAEMMKDWERHRKVLVDVLGRIDGRHVGFKPWDGAMPLGELAMHVAGWNHAFVALARTGELPAVQSAEGMSMDQIRQTVADLTEQTRTVYASLTGADLEAERQFFRFRFTGDTLLRIMYDHEVHHKGQLMLYARMVGVQELPFFAPPPRD